jgi:hypothetical protein
MMVVLRIGLIKSPRDELDERLYVDSESKMSKVTLISLFFGLILSVIDEIQTL